LSNRFDYIRYDEVATKQQALFKEAFQKLEYLIDVELRSMRNTSIAYTKLEECYWWIGKAIRDDQISRSGKAPILQEERKDG